MTSKESLPDVGQRLGAARLQRGLAQGAVAERAGIAASYLSRIETGKVQPAFRTVMHIMRVLDADPSEIMGPDADGKAARGPCPVTARGACLLDLIGPEADLERYSPRQVKLIRRFAAWLKDVPSDRVRAMEILLDDLSRAADSLRR